MQLGKSQIKYTTIGTTRRKARPVSNYEFKWIRRPLGLSIIGAMQKRRSMRLPLLVFASIFGRCRLASSAHLYTISIHIRTKGDP
jgi:hypothetical protein